MNFKRQSAIGLTLQEALDVEVRRIAREKRHSHECGLAAYPVADGISRFDEDSEQEIRVQPRLEFWPIL